MRISAKGLEFIKRHEGLRLTAYQDSAGVWTIGYGHTGRSAPPPVFPNFTITEAEAEDYLRRDLAPAERAVNSLVHVPLTQNQFDALVSWVFNLGEGNLRASTLLRVLNLGDYVGAAKQFDRWVYAGDVKLKGLINRRAEERGLFETPDKQVEEAPRPTPSPQPPTPTGFWRHILDWLIKTFGGK